MEFLTDLPQNQCPVQTQHLWHRQRVSLLFHPPASSERFFIFNLVFQPEPPFLKLVWRLPTRAWTQSPACFTRGAAQGDGFQGSPKLHSIVLKCLYETRALFFFPPKELFSNCSEEGREIKSQTLVLCGEATCFSQPTRIHSWALAWG